MEVEFKINWFVFVLFFSLGLLYVYIFTPQKKVIIKYPTPYNSGKFVYKDPTDNSCYIYESKEVPCTQNAKPHTI